MRPPKQWLSLQRPAESFELPTPTAILEALYERDLFAVLAGLINLVYLEVS